MNRFSGCEESGRILTGTPDGVKKAIATGEKADDSIIPTIQPHGRMAGPKEGAGIRRGGG